MKKRFCAVCRNEVPRSNDTGILNLLINGKLTAPMHIRKITEDGHVVCPGSSHEQYLEGMPRNPHYPYDPEQEPKIREGYKKLLNLTVREMKEIEKKLV